MDKHDGKGWGPGKNGHCSTTAGRCQSRGRKSKNRLSGNGSGRSISVDLSLPAVKASLLAAVAVFVCLLPVAAHAQLDEYRSSLDYRSHDINDMKLYDLNHDGKIDDWERDQVNFRLLGEMDLNHDGVVDAKDRKLAKERMKQLKAERAAEIKKYDKNGDGKLDEAENAVRLADEARERAKQKPSQAAAELSKPMVGY